VNWTYNLPNSHFESALAKAATNGWAIQGVASFVTGAPGVVTWSYNGDPNGATNGGNQGGPVTLSLSGSAPVVNSRGSATNFLNASAFKAAPNGAGVCVLNSPSTCGLGNVSPKDVFTQPGVNNWNISLFKNFQLGEARRLQFRWETYNTFNHTQFANLANTNLDASKSASFGQVTSAQPARIMALSLKFFF
jgi:hypothetical protein